MLCSLLSFEGKMMLYFFLFSYFNVYIFDVFFPVIRWSFASGYLPKKHKENSTFCLCTI